MSVVGRVGLALAIALDVGGIARQWHVPKAWAFGGESF